MSWTLFTRQGTEVNINPDPFFFHANLEQYKFFSNMNRTCMLWCIENSNLCAGASILDSDLWELAHHTTDKINYKSTTISGNWRIVSPGRLVLLYSESLPILQSSGPPWFQSLTSN
jgi:hypothetical protein